MGDRGSALVGALQLFKGSEGLRRNLGGAVVVVVAAVVVVAVVVAVVVVVAAIPLTMLVL